MDSPARFNHGNGQPHPCAVTGAGADFIQETAPEVLSMKLALHARISAAAAADVIIASSTSGLLPTEFAPKQNTPNVAWWATPSTRCIRCHWRDRRRHPLRCGPALVVHGPVRPRLEAALDAPGCAETGHTLYTLESHQNFLIEVEGAPSHCPIPSGQARFRAWGNARGAFNVAESQTRGEQRRGRLMRARVHAREWHRPVSRPS